MSTKIRTMPLTRKDLINLLGNEKLRVELAIILSGGVRGEMAKILDITERSLYRKLNQYGLDPEEVILKASQ